ncbi:MAG: hypothetical protein LAN37_14220 [Acidobacteriia bacterium]|nr:hypothetical protein [Terriglobia bacterium]
MTLEAFLNLLWVSLAVAAVAQWVAPSRRRRRAHLSELLSLTFILALLFPVISANDDLAGLALINDVKTSKAVSTSLKSDQQLPAPAGTPGLHAALTSQSVFSLPRASESVSEPVHAASVATPGAATGNHSPPLS